MNNVVQEQEVSLLMRNNEELTRTNRELHLLLAESLAQLRTHMFVIFRLAEGAGDRHMPSTEEIDSHFSAFSNIFKQQMGSVPSSEVLRHTGVANAIQLQNRVGSAAGVAAAPGLPSMVDQYNPSEQLMGYANYQEQDLHQQHRMDAAASTMDTRLPVGSVALMRPNLPSTSGQPGHDAVAGVEHVTSNVAATNRKKFLQLSSAMLEAGPMFAAAPPRVDGS